jgi:hypothetical protein
MAQKDWRGKNWDSDKPLYDPDHPIYKVTGTTSSFGISAGQVALPDIDDEALLATLRAFAVMDKLDNAAQAAPTRAMEAVAQQMVEQCAASDPDTDAPVWHPKNWRPYIDELGVPVAPQSQDDVKPYLNWVGGTKHASRHTKMAALLLYWSALVDRDQNPNWRCGDHCRDGCGGRKCPFSDDGHGPSEFARWVDGDLGGYTNFYDNREKYRAESEQTVPGNSSGAAPPAGGSSSNDNQSPTNDDYDFDYTPGHLGELRLAGYWAEGDRPPWNDDGLWMSPDNPRATGWAVLRFDIPSAQHREGPPDWRLCGDPEPPHKPELFDDKAKAGERLLKLRTWGVYRICPLCRSCSIPANTDICEPCFQKQKNASVKTNKNRPSTPPKPPITHVPPRPQPAGVGSSPVKERPTIIRTDHEEALKRLRDAQQAAKERWEHQLRRAEEERDRFKSQSEKLQATLDVKVKGHYNFDELADILFASGDPFEALSLANRLWELWREAWLNEHMAEADAAGEADEPYDDAAGGEDAESGTDHPRGSAPLSREHPTIRRLLKALKTALHPETNEGEIILAVMLARKLIASAEDLVPSERLKATDKTDVILKTMDPEELLKLQTEGHA